MAASRRGGASVVDAPTRSAPRAGPMSHNGNVIERRNDALGPIAAHGYTCTAVARVSRFDIAGSGFGFGWVHARPHHLDVLGPDGSHETIPIRDPGRALVRVSQAVVAATLLGIWLVRRSK